MELNELNDYLFGCDQKRVMIELGKLAKQEKGIKQIAAETGLNRKGLYMNFNHGTDPGLSKFLKIINALNLEIVIKD